MADAESKELSRELADSRARLSYHGAMLAERANVPRRLKQSVQRKPYAWVAAASVLGLAIAAIRPRKRVEVRTVFSKKEKPGKAAVIFGAAKVALDVFKPALTAFLKKKVSSAGR